MKKQAISDKTKQVILSKILLAEYRKVMKLHMDGVGKVEIAQKTGYSIRQVERIIPRCWREVCIMLADSSAPEVVEGWEKWSSRLWKCTKCGHLVSTDTEDEVLPKGYTCPECGGI